MKTEKARIEQMIPGLVASISIKGKTGLKPTDAQTLKMM
jgi:hypothetical protein